MGRIGPCLLQREPASIQPYQSNLKDEQTGGRAGLPAMRLDFGRATPILNYMVKYSDHALDRTFAALSDPTRRALLARLEGQHSVSVSELAQPFSMSLPAIMKHLDVLSDAGLIARAKTGRVVACRLTAGPMEQAMDWLNRYQRFWSEGLDRLAAFVEEDKWPPNQAPPPVSSPDRASPSNVVSMRSPAKSLRGVDRSGKNSPMVRALAGRRRLDTGRHRCAGRRPLPGQLQDAGRRASRSRRRLSRDGAEPEICRSAGRGIRRRNANRR